MNTINSAVQSMATDGQSLYTSVKINSSNVSTVKAPEVNNASDVANNIKQSIEEVKASAKEMENLSEVVTGRKLQFSVNKELNTVVVTIIDSNTNQVIKEIPSVDMQKLKLRIRKTLGNLYDKLV